MVDGRRKVVAIITINITLLIISTYASASPSCDKPFVNIT